MAVIERDGEFLVIRRAQGIPAGGSWCFPGGAVEPGETQQQALAREVREELGLEIQPVKVVWRWERPDGTLILHWWRALPVDGGFVLRPDTAEVADVRWVSPSRLLQMSPVLESNLAFLRECLGTRQNGPDTGE